MLKMLTKEQRDKAIGWFQSLQDHFGQTYIMLLAPQGLVELNPPCRAWILARGGVGQVINEDGFLCWLYHTYRDEIEKYSYGKGGEETEHDRSFTHIDCKH